MRLPVLFIFMCSFPFHFPRLHSASADIEFYFLVPDENSLLILSIRCENSLSPVRNAYVCLCFSTLPVILFCLSLPPRNFNWIKPLQFPTAGLVGVITFIASLAQGKKATGALRLLIWRTCRISAPGARGHFALDVLMRS